jgi:mono/diheme cytochrome c family protein
MTIHTPIESRTSRIPGWAIGLTAFVLLVGGVYFASNLSGENPPFAVPGQSASAPAGSAAADPAVGQALIGQAQPACTSCHGPDLTGAGNFPTLHGVADGPTTPDLQPLADANPDTWIHLWIDGTQPETADLNRNGMPEFGEQFSPEQIDSIVAYLKTLP